MRLVRRFFVDLFGAYGDGVRSIIALWPLFALLIGSEFIQHIAEVHVGFFANKEAAKALSNDGSRTALGWVKMLSVYVGGFFVIRYLIQHKGQAPLDPPGMAIKHYLPYIVYSLFMFSLIFYGPKLLPPSTTLGFRAIVSLAQIAIEPLLILWIVSAATDGRVTSPLKSMQRTGTMYLWGLALFFVGRIPINAAHALLNVYAIGKGASVLWLMLALDAVCVGLLIAIVPALYVRIASFITERRSLSVAGRSAPQAA